MTDSRCVCGATLVRSALACSLCHTPVPASVGSAGGTPAADQVVGPNGFLASAPPATQRNDQRVFSRTQSGPMSFGWTGRIILTVLAALPIAFVWFMSGGGVITLVGSLPVLILPLWIIRESWRRGRVR